MFFGELLNEVLDRFIGLLAPVDVHIRDGIPPRHFFVKGLGWCRIPVVTVVEKWGEIFVGKIFIETLAFLDAG